MATPQNILPDWRTTLPDAMADSWLDEFHGGDEIICFALIDGVDCMIARDGIKLYLNGAWHKPVTGFALDDLCLETFSKMVAAGVRFPYGRYTLTGAGVCGSSTNVNPYDLKKPVILPSFAFPLFHYNVGDVEDYLKGNNAGILCQCGLSYAIAINPTFKRGVIPATRPAHHAIQGGQSAL